MPKRDFTQVAFDAFKRSVGEDEAASCEPAKNPAAVELGRKGGTERAAKLSEERRKAIAQQGGKARWAKRT